MANRAVAGTGTTQNRSVAGTGTASTYSKPSSTGGTTGGSGGGGGSKSSKGGSGSNDDDKKQQKKTQAQLNNTGGNYQKRKNDIDKITKGRKNDLEKTATQRKADMDKIAKQQLGNIKQQQEANDAALATNQRNIMQQVSWQPNQQKEQSTLMALRNRMGNAAYGSGIQDLAEGMGRVDDMNDVELINTWKQNENAAYSNWFQANQSLIGDYNDQIASIEDEYSQFAADYSDQMSKLNRDYQDEVSQLYSQYWSTMSNVNPELATASNLKKAAQNKAGTSKTAKAVTKADNVLDAVNKLAKTYKYSSKKANKTKSLIDGINNALKKAKMTSAEQKAFKLIEKAAADKKNTKGKKDKDATSAIIKAATKAAKDSLSKAKDKNRVSVGKKDEKFYLPNVDLRGKADLTSNLAINTNALGSLMKPWQNASSQNARTAAYVRPDAGRGDVLLGGANGAINNSRAANTGFSDNLAAFRRV